MLVRFFENTQRTHPCCDAQYASQDKTSSKHTHTQLNQRKAPAATSAHDKPHRQLFFFSPIRPSVPDLLKVPQLRRTDLPSAGARLVRPSVSFDGLQSGDVSQADKHPRTGGDHVRHRGLEQCQASKQDPAAGADCLTPLRCQASSQISRLVLIKCSIILIQEKALGTSS